MPILRSQQLIFVHIPKTAGTSIEKALGICGTDNNGDNTCNRKLIFGYDGKQYLQHLFASELRDEIGCETFDTCFKFAIIRNPFARLLSAYKGWYCKFSSFPKFVTKVVPKSLKEPIEKDAARHLRPQSLFIFDDAGRKLVDYIGRYETLYEDIAKISSLSDVPVSLGKPRQPKSSTYADQYSDKLRRLVELYYEDDFRRFAYCFKEAMPVEA